MTKHQLHTIALFEIGLDIETKFKLKGIHKFYAATFSPEDQKLIAGYIIQRQIARDQLVEIMEKEWKIKPKKGQLKIDPKIGNKNDRQS